MNTRVLELIKNPKIITESDLNILESESEKMPYAQSLRALYLYGINLYKSEKYKENLSKTAAYTTDKKILYQFINSEKNQKKDNLSLQNIQEENTENQIIPSPAPDHVKPAQPELVTEIEKTDNNSVLNKFDVEKIIEAKENESSEFLVIDGEKNRLLYEGEENFLKEKTQQVDLDASKESGQLVLKEEIKEIATQISIDDNRSEESIFTQEISETQAISEETSPEEAVSETESQKEISSNDISFGGIQDFLPEVKFSVPKNHLDYLNPPKKEKKQEEKVNIESEIKKAFTETIPEKELEVEDSNGISFENTQVFEFSRPAETKSLPVEKTDQNQEENQSSFEKIPENKTEGKLPEPEMTPSLSEVRTEIKEESVSEWKPMQLSNNIPDALIGQTKEREIPKIIEKIVITPVENLQSEPIIIDKTSTIQQEAELSESERPVFNVSFFGDEVSKIEDKRKIPSIIEKEETSDTKESNVGTFINTWQSWLKIDRSETIEEPSKAKEKIIDNFIEANPKISQLKEESSYVIKEKKDDISHLMTETLAKLYIEQKLYSKAIKAYEILSEKHPDKKTYFGEKIEEIKEIRKL